MKRAETLEAVQERPPIRALTQESLRRGEEVRNQWRLVLPPTARYEDLLGDEAAKLVNPLGAYLTRGDVFEILPNDGSFFAMVFLVEYVPGRHARFVELFRKELPGEAIDALEGSGEWRAGFLGWVRMYGVIHPNGNVFRDGIRTRGEAEQDAHQRNKPSYARSTLG